MMKRLGLKLNSHSNPKHFFHRFLASAVFIFPCAISFLRSKKRNWACEKAMKKRFAFEYEFSITIKKHWSLINIFHKIRFHYLICHLFNYPDESPKNLQCCDLTMVHAGLRVQTPHDSLQLGSLFVPLSTALNSCLFRALEGTLSCQSCVHVFLTHSVYIKECHRLWSPVFFWNIACWH